MLKRLLGIIYLLFSLAFLLYLLMPGPSSIDDFLELPNSTTSSYEGDTIQVPDVAAYFSNNYRVFAIPFYSQNFQAKTKFFFPPIRLNHPPEDAFAKIKDQTQSTYLEELTYPFRDSLYINGFEPLENGLPRYRGADRIEYDGDRYDTKVIIRYYSSSIVSRITLWLGINMSVILLLYIGRKVLKND
jgi:hypothetical protein